MGDYISSSPLEASSACKVGLVCLLAGVRLLALLCSSVCSLSSLRCRSRSLFLKLRLVVDVDNTACPVQIQLSSSSSFLLVARRTLCHPSTVEREQVCHLRDAQGQTWGSSLFLAQTMARNLGSGATIERGLLPGHVFCLHLQVSEVRASHVRDIHLLHLQMKLQSIILDGGIGNV